MKPKNPTPVLPGLFDVPTRALPNLVTEPPPSYATAAAVEDRADDGKASLDLRGMVRADDWDTSVDAAAAVEPHRSALHERILAAFRLHGPLSDERLERLPEFAEYGQTTISKRRTELLQRGFLVAVGVEINSRGRKMLVWTVREG